MVIQSNKHKKYEEIHITFLERQYAANLLVSWHMSWDPKKSIEKFLTPYSDQLTDYKEDEVGDDDEADEEEEEGWSSGSERLCLLMTGPMMTLEEG